MFDSKIHSPNLFDPKRSSERSRYRNRLRSVLLAFEDKELSCKERRIIEGIKSKSLAKLDDAEYKKRLEKPKHSDFFDEEVGSSF